MDGVVNLYSGENAAGSNISRPDVTLQWSQVTQPRELIRLDTGMGCISYMQSKLMTFGIHYIHDS